MLARHTRKNRIHHGENSDEPTRGGENLFIKARFVYRDVKNFSTTGVWGVSIGLQRLVIASCREVQEQRGEEEEEEEEEEERSGSRNSERERLMIGSDGWVRLFGRTIAFSGVQILQHAHGRFRKFESL